MEAVIIQMLSESGSWQGGTGGRLVGSGALGPGGLARATCGSVPIRTQLGVLAAVVPGQGVVWQAVLPRGKSVLAEPGPLRTHIPAPPLQSSTAVGTASKTYSMAL